MKAQDIIVVGGGVAGAACALGLAQAGFSVVLLERGARPKPFDAQGDDLRVYALAPGSSAFLKRLGVWPALAAQRVSPYEQMRVWEHHAAQALHFSAAQTGVAQLGHIVENDLLLASLWAALALARVEVVCAAHIEALDFSARAAQLTLADGRVFKAPLLIAADGADSSLRALAGIEVEEYRYPQQALVCHVRTQQPHQATAWQRFMDDGVLALLPLADGRSSVVWSTTRAAELLALDDAAFCAALSAASEQALGAVLQTTPRLRFPLRLLHARDYVRERFALLGDAAHVVHPLAGQGVNLGLADAQALIEVLTQARQAGQDIGALRRLKPYARARRADTLDMLALTDGLYRSFGPAAQGWSEARYAGMQALNRLPLLKTWLTRRALQA